jgi:hypothetical protein
MAAFSDYLELKIAQWVTNAAAMGASPAALYVALFNGSPTDAGGSGTELTNTLRGTTTRTTIALTAAQVSGTTSLKNGAQVVITSSASAGATATHMGIFDLATNGNLLFHGELNGGVPKVIAAQDEVRFNIDQLTITIA